jgi:von Willebrand factor type A domain
MRKTAYLIGLSLACWTGAAMSACGSSGNVTGGSGGTAATASQGTGTSTGGKGMTSTGSGEGGSFLDAGVGGGSVQQDGDACGSVALKGTVTPGHIIVVFDQSDSMQDPFPDADGGTQDGGVLPKWHAAEDAIVAAVTPIENLLDLGAIFIPTGADGACTVAQIGTAPQIAIEPGPAFLTAFQGHFSAAGWTTILGTPLELGLAAANTALTPAPSPGQSAVVVLTDGAPNCGKSTLAEVEPPIVAMAMRGIKTYVIGLPGSASAATLLNGLAVAGGTTSYYSPSDPTDLQMHLAQIASDTVDQCTITLSPPPSDPSMVHLIVTDAASPNGVEIAESEDGGGDGWSLSADGTTATLLGTTCTNAKAGDYTSITFVYGCPTLPQ